MKYIKELLDLPLEEQRAALSYVATQKGLPQVVVEKDLWVTILLHILFGENGSNGILFKGGCSSRFIRTVCRSDSDSFKVEIF